MVVGTPNGDESIETPLVFVFMVRGISGQIGRIARALAQDAIRARRPIL